MNVPQGFESILPDYPVKLDNFEGPLDLLLHLIRKHEIDIYDIPIALVTEQYLAYLDLMQELDLDVAGEFLVMAATLIHIKSRMLVPRIETQEEAEELEDPRDALVQRLLEHQQFKAAAELLHERETVRSAQWTRPDGRVADLADEPIERELEVDLFSLLQGLSGGGHAGARAPEVRGSVGPHVDRDAHRAIARAPVRHAGLRVRGAVFRRRDPAGVHHHVSGAARDDPPEAGPRVPGRAVRPHTRVRPGAARRRPAARRSSRRWLTTCASCRQLSRR